MICAASTLASSVTVVAIVYAVGGCCGAFIVWNSLRVLGGIGLLAVAADTRPVKRALGVY